MFKYVLKLSLLLCLFLPTLAAAQSQPICPAEVLLGLVRAGSACFQTGQNQMCYGNGDASAEFQAEGQPFSQPGDRVGLGAVSRTTVTLAENDVSVVNLLVQGALADSEARQVALLLWGDAELINGVPFNPELVVRARGTLNVRRTPETNAEIVLRQAINETLIASGRSVDGRWLRVNIPDSSDLGWVSAEVVTVEGNIGTLTVVDVASPYYRPFEVFQLLTRDAGLCGGVLRGGLLIQSPNIEIPTRFIMNGLVFQVAATAYLHTHDADTLTISVLDGWVEVEAEDTSLYVPAGTQVLLSLNDDGQVTALPAAPTPYSDEEMALLPVNNLPRRVRVAASLTAEQIEAVLTAHHTVVAALAADEPSGEATSACQRIVLRDTPLWAGPGEFYEVVNEIVRGRGVTPVLQVRDADGVLWWQLRNTNWIRADWVTQSGLCEDIPLTDAIPTQRTNTLSLETCMTRNGPLRVGQVVTIEFTPAP